MKMHAFKSTYSLVNRKRMRAHDWMLLGY